MHITQNTTRCRAESFAWSDKAGQRHCIVVIKATYDVRIDGVCEWSAEPRPWVWSDDHHGEPDRTAIRYGHDFAPVKPRIDVLINGWAFAPGHRPVGTMEVSIEGPGIRKVAQVTGDRLWENGPLGIAPSRPSPFARLPLVWHRAFGGSDLSHDDPSAHGAELRNPVGIGFHLNRSRASILGRPLPNIEGPDARMRTWSDKPDPVGFGPIGPGWAPRVRFAGTYDRHWVEETMPFLPKDFDERFFQSAPMDQQLDELPAGSVFVCHNMNEDGRYVVRVPDLSVPVRYVFSDHTEKRVVVPDTVLLEPDERRLTVLGRTSARLPRKLTALREIQVGQTPVVRDASKPRYASLGQAVAALKRRS